MVELSKEPAFGFFTGLDPRAMDVDQFIRELQINTLVTTHDMRLVQELFPCTIIIDEGRDMSAGADVRINYLQQDGVVQW